METRLHHPDRHRISILAALVLLAYTLLRLVALPEITGQFSLLGLIFSVEINTRLVMLSLAAAITASGANWVIQSHPLPPRGYAHTIIPALAAFGFGSILARVPQGAALFAGLALIALVLTTIIRTEFVVLDPQDERYPLAAWGLKFLGLLLIVGSYFAIRVSGMRAAYAVPLIFAATTIIAWRLLQLGTETGATWRQPLLLGLLISQLGLALHYWPILPLQGAMLLGLGAFLGLELIHGVNNRSLDRRRSIELISLALLSLLVITIFL